MLASWHVTNQTRVEHLDLATSDAAHSACLETPSESTEALLREWPLSSTCRTRTSQKIFLPGDRSALETRQIEWDAELGRALTCECRSTQHTRPFLRASTMLRLSTCTSCCQLRFDCLGPRHTCRNRLLGSVRLQGPIRGSIRRPSTFPCDSFSSKSNDHVIPQPTCACHSAYNSLDLPDNSQTTTTRFVHTT